MLLTMSDDKFNSKYNQAILSFLYGQNSNVQNKDSNPPVRTKINTNSKSDELKSVVIESLGKDAYSSKITHEDTFKFDSPIISDTLETQEIKSKETETLRKTLEGVKPNLTVYETEFNEKGKLARRNWQSIDLVATFILKKSNYKGHKEALIYFQKQSTFDQYSIDNDFFYSVQFDLLKEDDFRGLFNVTTKVRKFTEVEIEGNYFNPTELNLALWLLSSKSEIEYRQRLDTSISSNSAERLENALEIKNYLEILKRKSKS